MNLGRWDPIQRGSLAPRKIVIHFVERENQDRRSRPWWKSMAYTSMQRFESRGVFNFMTESRKNILRDTCRSMGRCKFLDEFEWAPSNLSLH